MRALGRILAAAAALSGAVVAINHVGIARLALTDPDTWDGGRGPEAVRLTVGVFGGGAAVMAVVALLAIVAVFVAGRRPLSAFWLLVIPGILGLVATAAASGVYVALQPSGSRFLAYIIVPLAVPSLLALVAGLFMRTRTRSTAPLLAPAGAATSNHGRTSLMTLVSLALFCLTLLLALPATTSAIYLPDRDPATLEEAAQMVRDMQESGASNLRIAGWLSGVLDRRIININSLERMSIGGNWIPWPFQSESTADKAFGEWRDRNDFNHANTAAWAWENGLGQCGEHAATAYTILKRAGVAESVRILSAPGHEFVVWGMPSGADPDDPTTWGDNAWVVDGWLGRAVLPGEVRVSPYFKAGRVTVRLGEPGRGRPLVDSTTSFDPQATAWGATPAGQVSAENDAAPSDGDSGTPGSGEATPGGGQDQTPVEPQSVRYEGTVTVLNTPPLPVYELADSHVELVVAGGTVSVIVEFTLVAVLKWDGQDHLCTATMYRRYEGQGPMDESLSVELRLVDYSDALQGPDCGGVVATRVDSQPLVGSFSDDGTFAGTIRNAWRITATTSGE